MIAIIGLGNPGKKYQGTRHNVGFRVLDRLAKRKELIRIDQKKLPFILDYGLKAKIAESHLKENQIILAQPTTFINDSGSAIRKIKEKFHLKPKDIWVVCDDLNLAIGMIRTRSGGSSGGHNGLKDIIQKLGDQDFPRLRIGIKPIKGFGKESIDRQKGIDTKKFVLASFTRREKKIIEKATEKAVEYLIRSLEKGIISATTID